MKTASAILVGAILPVLVSAAPARKAAVELKGYEAVQLERGPSNHLFMRVQLNGHPAVFLVDTGASVSCLESRRAQSLGVEVAGTDSPFGQFVYTDSRTLRTGIIRSLRAGKMDFGQGPIALYEAGNVALSRLGPKSQNVDGIIGIDILRRYKAAINCRTQQIFLKTNPERSLHLVSSTNAMGFKRVPLRLEDNGSLTVPCTINGGAIRALVDTGAFVTVFDQSTVARFGVKRVPSRLQAVGFDGKSYSVELGQFDQLAIGGFRVAPQKLAVAELPTFTRSRGTDGQVAAILGSELLDLYHAIIDLDSMSLFLK